MAAESMYDVSVQFDLDNLPANKGETDVNLILDVTQIIASQRNGL